MEFMMLRVSARTLNTIGAGLQELPFKIAKPAIDEIDAQVQAHLREQGNERTESGKTGDADGSCNQPDRNYVNQDRQAG